MVVELTEQQVAAVQLTDQAAVQLLPSDDSTAATSGDDYVQLVSLDEADLAVESWKAQGLETLRISPDLNQQEMHQLKSEIDTACDGELEKL